MVLAKRGFLFQVPSLVVCIALDLTLNPFFFFSRVNGKPPTFKPPQVEGSGILVGPCDPPGDPMSEPGGQPNGA